MLKLTQLTDSDSEASPTVQTATCALSYALSTDSGILILGNRRYARISYVTTFADNSKCDSFYTCYLLDLAFLVVVQM